MLRSEGVFMKTIATKKAPAAIGPYVQGVVAGGLLFASGQIALDPQTGELVGKTVEEQSEQVMRNMGAILESAGIRLSKRRVFLTTWTISRRSIRCTRVLSKIICPLGRLLPWRGFPKGLS